MFPHYKWLSCCSLTIYLIVYVMSSSEPQKRMSFSSDPVNQIGCVSPYSDVSFPFQFRHRICHGAWCLSMGGTGALNYLPIVPKASIYVPKVMCKPVMGDNTVSETFMHMFLFRSVWSFKNWPRPVNLEHDGWVWEGRVCWIIFPLCPKPPYMSQR